MAKVLVADDVKTMRDLIKQILESDGHEVEEVSTGKGVIQLLSEENHYDLVLLDIGMPDLNGIETMKKIAEIGGEAPKVCFVTGEKDQKTVLQALKAGGSDFIVKPIDIVVFKDKMSKLIGGSQDPIVKVKTNLKAEIPEFPVPVDLTITELSELGFTLVSSITFKEKSNINVTSETITSLMGEEFKFPCLVQSVFERKKTGNFELQCNFVGLHDNHRQKIRQLTMRGGEINDPTPDEENGAA